MPGAFLSLRSGADFVGAEVDEVAFVRQSLTVQSTELVKKRSEKSIDPLEG